MLAENQAPNTDKRDLPITHEARRVLGARFVALGSTFALPALVFVLALLLYVRTGAPSVLTGDQAEHQFTAYMVGVPHATGYPLFTSLNALAVRLLPIGDVARRVTLMTALWSALAVMLAFIVARRLSGSWLAGLLAAATLSTSTEFWSLSVIAEVYTLQALLILLIWWLLLRWWAAPKQVRWLYLATFCSGVAVTHHGSFVPIVVPALFFTVAVPFIRAGSGEKTVSSRQSPYGLRTALYSLLFGLLGLTPWLYLAVQFALFRPFDYYRGQGLPYHYYWGYPSTWHDVINLAFGAGFRGKVFTYGWNNLWMLTLRFGKTLGGEMWWSGLLLGGVGGVILLLRHPRAGRLSALVFVGAALFGINVAGDIPKAHVYYLPAYVIWSIWAGVGAGWLVQIARHYGVIALQRWCDRPTAQLTYALGAITSLALLLLIALPLVRGQRHFDQLDRSHDDVPRQLATAVLARVEPHAVILCRWELCESLRYLQFVEGQRLDVLLDQTEPEAGSDWAERAALYLPQHPVYALQMNEQLAARYNLYPVSEEYDLWQVLSP